MHSGSRNNLNQTGCGNSHLTTATTAMTMTTVSDYDGDGDDDDNGDDDDDDDDDDGDDFTLTFVSPKICTVASALPVELCGLM